MLSHQEYTAWISIDGQPLETYGVKTSLATNEVTCWIASEVGKEFSVHCQDTSTTRRHTSGLYLDIDGQRCGSKVLYEATHARAQNDTVSISDVSVSDTTVKPFVFSAVQLTDEDNFADMSSAALGQIQLEVWNVVILQAIPPAKYHIQAEHKVHERSKKAITHCVGLGKETAASKLAMQWVQSRRIGQQPLATFTFKYRDPNLLRANGVIPAPAPLKRKASQEIIDLTVHEVKEESKILTHRGIKEESKISNGLVRGERNSHARMKMEHRKKRIKQEQKPGEQMECIDLT